MGAESSAIRPHINQKNKLGAMVFRADAGRAILPFLFYTRKIRMSKLTCNPGKDAANMFLDPEECFAKWKLHQNFITICGIRQCNSRFKTEGKHFLLTMAVSG